MKFLSMISILLILGIFLIAPSTFAQNNDDDTADDNAWPQPQSLKGTGTGISGGIIAGAEVVLVVESIFDVKPVWPWVVFPILGAGGGGVGGYFLEQKSAGGSIALLVTSMLAIVPTAIAVSTARAYDPVDEGAVELPPTQKLLFEQEPSTETVPEESTQTEVESRPEGIPGEAPAIEPANPEGPPAPKTTPEAPATGEQSSVAPKKSAVKQHTLAIGPRQNDRTSHLRSGSLFHINHNYHAGFGIPQIDIAPSSYPQQQLTTSFEPGIEIKISVFKMDLP